MMEQRNDNARAYDKPIPKPPDELFDDFMRRMEARLVTKRFNINSRRTVKPVSGSSE